MSQTGRVLLFLNGFLTIIGSFMADYGKTHMFNPRWPPHAKFHTGQTLSMAAVLGLSIMYYTVIDTTPSNVTPGVKRAMRLQQLNFAFLLSLIYFGTQLAATQYPNTLCVDPEFGEGCPQYYLGAGFLSVTAVGYALERRRIAGGSGVKTA